MVVQTVLLSIESVLIVTHLFKGLAELLVWCIEVLVMLSNL